MKHKNEPVARFIAEQSLPKFQVKQAQIAAFTRRIKPLSGGALKILLVLLVTRRAFSKKELHVSIGIAYATIRRSLRQLEEAGAVTPTSEGKYHLSDNWWQDLIRLILATRLAQLEEYDTSPSRPRARTKEHYLDRSGPLNLARDLGKGHSDNYRQPVVISVQPVETNYQAGEWSGQAIDRSCLVGEQNLRPTTTVVVEDLSEEEKKNKYIQQQHSFRARQVVPSDARLDEFDSHRQLAEHHGQQAGEDEHRSSDHAPGEGHGLSNANPLPVIGEEESTADHGDPALGTDSFDSATEENTPTATEYGEKGIRTQSETQSRLTRRKLLASYLKRAGILGKAYQELLERPDLQLDPRPVLAWWWYALAQEGIRQPAALAIRLLQRRDPAPPGYLDLVSMWRRIKPSHRLSIEEMVQRNWSAEEMARHWTNAYPEGTAKAFIALKELYMVHPEVLGF